VSVRDKVKTKYNFTFNSTFEFMEAVKRGELPNEIMFNTHPHRWNETTFRWAREWAIQSVKNVAKAVLARRVAPPPVPSA